MSQVIELCSWNVKGIRACLKKGFLSWFEAEKASVIGLQEVRALSEQLPEELRAPSGWTAEFSAAEKKGYSGVGLYSRWRPDELDRSLGRDEFDREGRLILARFGKLWVANVYFPNGSGRRDNSRVPFKLDFYRALREKLRPLLFAGEPVVVMGDWNTAHREIDLARPRANQNTSGFLPEERAELDEWIGEGWGDSFRLLHPEQGERYSWWSFRSGARARNVGWRIDAIFLSPAAREHLKGAEIDTDTMGSDHCPVRVQLDAEILGHGVDAPQEL
ncbi:MAG: exodeoxyribonuclease III [Myxococcota bacterium]|nr:exodeoxyribonuclease III [Myxococcota bacterium]